MDDGSSSTRSPDPLDDEGEPLIVVLPARPPRPRRVGLRVALVCVAVLAVVGIVAGLPSLRSIGYSPGGQGDWPGQFTRCGERADDVVTADEPGPTAEAVPVVPVELALREPSAQVGSHEKWTSEVTASTADSSPEGWVYGTDLTLVRDGVVVAVQDGPQVPRPQQVADWQGDYGTAPVPLVTDVSLGLSSCDQYLHRDGSAAVEPGSYDLVVSQTVGLLREGESHVGWGVAETTVTVVDDGEVAAQGPLACGAPIAGLEALASQEGNPAPLRLEVLGETGAEHDVVVRATNTGVEPIAATTGHPGLVIARDGVIVGGLDAQDSVGLQADLAVGGHADYDASTNAFDCATVGVGDHADTSDGDPLPAGEYTLWSVMSFTGEGLPTTATTLVAGGPVPFTIGSPD